MKTDNRCTSWRIWVLGAALLSLLVTWGMFHVEINRALTDELLLRARNPSEEFFFECAASAKDPVQFLERCWDTGKVCHRQLVAAFLKESASFRKSWLNRAEPLLLACTTDADASVRELGLAALENEHSPRLLEAARAQLDDLDPNIRLLGLDYVRRSEPKKAVPILMRSLDDPDLRIVAAAEVGLMRISAEDYGVRARLAIPSQANTGQMDPANVETIRQGVEKRKAWWQSHQREYALLEDASTRSGETRSLCSLRPAAPDFTLHDLQRDSIRLSKFKGKVVLLNFWTTWCSACLLELPDLEVLQEKMGNQIVILGVALDGVPDEDGDSVGEEGDGGSHKGRPPSTSAIRAKVQRAVKARRINYPVLLDPKNSVGGQYNGGELPTTVILDAEGRVRRRFIGERSLSVFEAMIAEAGKSFPAAH